MPIVLGLAACGGPSPQYDAGDLLITGGRIVDPVQVRASEPVDLLVADGQFVRYGVTAVFVPGGGQGNDVQLRDWKLHCAENPGSCPRLFGSGSLITAYGSHPITTIWAFPADSDPELIRARGAIGITEQDSVDDLIQEKLSANVDALKIVVDDGPGPFAPKPRLSRAKVAEICTKAHAEGLRVFAHISLAEHVDDVVDGNCDGIMHSPANPISKETLRKMAEGGLSEAEALKGAAVTAAGFLDQHEHLGKLQSGFNADIVALRRNPLEDIRNTRAIEFVVVGGARVSNAVAIP